MPETQEILIIGAGNMALPNILSLAQRDDISHLHLTIICGSSGGKNDKGHLLKSLNESGGQTNQITLLNRDALSQADIDALTPHTILFCAKPQQFDDIASTYEKPFHSARLFITIAAGLETPHIAKTLSPDAAIVRTMPHQPLAACGFYASDRVALEQAKFLLKGYGQPVEIPSEEAMHTYLAHAGSGPAFVAEFLNQFQQEDLRALAAEYLLTLTEHSELDIAATPHNQATLNACRKFYAEWAKQADHDFSDSGTAQMITDTTIGGTIAFMRHRNLTPADFIAMVRSKKGTTNAGLLVMGNDCPDDESFGNKEQLSEQHALAAARSSLLAADSIADALTATIARSKAMSQGHGQDPVAGIPDEMFD